jgi:ankyrin repeat protein
VHWAVLHGKVDALRVLLRHGCSPHPPKPKTSAGKRTSGAVEFPTETCDRLYAGTEVGNQMHVLLHA